MGKNRIAAKDNPKATPKTEGSIRRLARSRSPLELRQMERAGGTDARSARLALLLRGYLANG